MKVMSFNVRYGTARDGENRWENRREFVIETIRAFDPDLLGTQETLGFQRDELQAAFSEFGNVGVGRDNGYAAGEMTAIFYRKSRFELIDSGHFWLSETPERPGSISWDSSLTRMASWVKLKDRLGDRAELYFLNTHFDHRGKQARAESARLIRRWISDLPQSVRVIVTGDFNAAENSEPYRALFEPKPELRPLVDTYRIHFPKPEENESTAGGFTVAERRSARIDWIGCSEQFRITTAAIDRTNREGRTPSDHYPVTATLKLKR